MDKVTFVRVAYTVICFLFFMAVLWFAYRYKPKSYYEEEGHRIIDDEDLPES